MSKTAFLDVDTQFDFMYPAGALPVPGAERIVPVIARLNRFAAQHGYPVISTTDAHAEDDLEFRLWPHHCVASTLGQRKPGVTLLERRVVVPNREAPPRLEGAQQIVLEKQTVNLFETATLARVLQTLGAERFVVYGVVTEICVLHAARGLLQLGKQVDVVTDAIAGLSAEHSARALGELRESGAGMVIAARLIGS